MKENQKRIFSRVKSIAKWCLILILLGIISGGVGGTFHLLIDYVTELRHCHSWILYGLPLGGVIIAALYAMGKNAGNLDTGRVLEAADGEKDVPFIMAPLIFLSTVITHLFGGSAGREGAALQLGGSMGYNLGKLFRLEKRDLQIIVMAGMSAVFAALFGTPFAAVFFAIEVIRVGNIRYEALLPCAAASLISFSLVSMMGIKPVRFALSSVPSFTADAFFRVIILAALCGVVGIIFCATIHKTEHLFKEFLPNKYIRAILGAIIVIGLTLLVGSKDYNGAGMDVVGKALSGQAKTEAFFLKIIFTAITIAAGFKGGEIVPAFFVGSTFGCVAASLLGLDPAFGAAIGFIALFCSVVNAPVASLLLAMEVFGGGGMVFFALACAVSFKAGGKCSLYKSQKFPHFAPCKETPDAGF